MKIIKIPDLHVTQIGPWTSHKGQELSQFTTFKHELEKFPEFKGTAYVSKFEPVLKMCIV